MLKIFIEKNSKNILYSSIIYLYMIVETMMLFLRNLDTMLVLKNLGFQHKLDFIFIAKPIICCGKLHPNFWRQFGLRKFFNLRSCHFPRFSKENILSTI